MEPSLLAFHFIFFQVQAVIDRSAGLLDCNEDLSLSLYQQQYWNQLQTNDTFKVSAVD